MHRLTVGGLITVGGLVAFGASRVVSHARQPGTGPWVTCWLGPCSSRQGQQREGSSEGRTAAAAAHPRLQCCASL